MFLPLRGPLRSLLRIERVALIRFVLTSLAASTLPMVTILLLHQFLAGVLGAGQGLASALGAAVGARAAIWILAVLLLATFLATAAADFHNTVVRQRLVRTLELRVMERLVHHLLTLSVLTIDKQSPGDILEAVRQDVGRLRIVLVSGSTLVLRGLTAAALIASAIWLSPGLAALAFPVLLLAALPIVSLARRVRRRGYGFRRRAHQALDVVLQMLRGIRVIKIYQGEAGEAQRAVQHMRAHYAELMESTRAQALGQVALESLGGLSVVVIVIIGGFQVTDGTLTWPSLLAFLMAIRSTQGPLFEINSHLLHVQRNMAGVERLDELLSEPPSPRDQPDALPLNGPVARVAFERVGYSYDAATPVLVAATFEVAQGEILGIVGRSGAGKTTLLSLAARFFDPIAGTVRINGRDARTLRLSDLHAQVALVTQEPFLFSASVRENIRCGRPGASDADVEAAARVAEVHDEIVGLPQGYDTLIGTSHRGLSGGQIQRINIARAALKNASLLLLDEATSSLDSIAEARVQRAIARLMQGRTTLVVAHRLSTLRHATRILVLDGGGIVSQGTHEELLRDSPLYRRMWHTQTRKATRPHLAAAADGVPP
jgi:ABC-type multidrug transport system fused ATPase/permease subunit